MLIFDLIHICCMVGGDCLVREKVLRFCPSGRRRVVCHGLCTVVGGVGVGSEAVRMCAVRGEALDCALNCR